jgi:hypothetical protein
MPHLPNLGLPLFDGQAAECGVPGAEWNISTGPHAEAREYSDGRTRRLGQSFGLLVLQFRDGQLIPHDMETRLSRRRCNCTRPVGRVAGH